MAGDGQKELQLLPSPPSSCPRSPSSKSPPLKFKPTPDRMNHHHDLELKLSISLAPIHQAPSSFTSGADQTGGGCVEALKWQQAAEQIRLAAIEKAYAERVRELTRREMELAQSEFARARHMWQRAREEVERAERLKERATRKIDPTCMEITCQSCRQRFRPS